MTSIAYAILAGLTGGLAFAALWVTGAPFWAAFGLSLLTGNILAGILMLLILACAPQPGDHDRGF